MFRAIARSWILIGLFTPLNLYGENAPHIYTAHPFPKKLSAWNIFTTQDGQNFSLNSHMVPYTIQNSLFTDYAKKFRALYIPPSKQIAIEEGKLIYPVGSLLIKVFGYESDEIQRTPDTPRSENPAQFIGELSSLDSWDLVEIRLMVKGERGWRGIPYLWQPDYKDADQF